MVRSSLQTKFLLSLTLITTALTCATLLIVRYLVGQRARAEIREALQNSVVTFQRFQRDREATLARSAGLLADLPDLRALMTTHDEATIQDGSVALWRLVGSDLFALADRTGKLVALHTVAGGIDRKEAQEALRKSIQAGETRDWWLGGGRLHEVFLQPIYFGSPSSGLMLGVLAVGYEINSEVAEEIGQVASGRVAFRLGQVIVKSTLPIEQEQQLTTKIPNLPDHYEAGTSEVNLGGERFLETSVHLAPAGNPTVSLTVLRSYDQATAVLHSLNRSLLGVGIVAVIVGCLLVYLISHTFTRPLSALVQGVRALEKGDFGYPLPRIGDEVGELTNAFARMRGSLHNTQQELIHAERLATIGQTASAISHDLRHHLTAILAYAEFLGESSLGEEERRDFYQKIRLAVDRMGDLISSLLVISRDSMNPHTELCRVEDCIERALQTLQARPEFHQVDIAVHSDDRCEGWFNPKKLERIFHNLLLNAYEAVSHENGVIEIHISHKEQALEVRVADNGPGIPEAIRNTIFQPFVSYGKENGTGLGLAVVQKMVQDHGGSISVESTGSTGTVFKLVLPRTHPSGTKVVP